MKEAMEKASLEQQSKPVSPEQQINEGSIGIYNKFEIH